MREASRAQNPTWSLGWLCSLVHGALSPRGNKNEGCADCFLDAPLALRSSLRDPELRIAIKNCQEPMSIAWREWLHQMRPKIALLGDTATEIDPFC